MNTRYLTTVAVGMLSLTVGACAGRVLTAPPPAAPTPAVAYEAAVEPVEAPEIAVLPVRDLQLGALMSGTAFTEPEPTCDIAAVVAKTATDAQLAAAELHADKTLHRYIEVRAGGIKALKDYQKDIALRVLDTETCTTQIITITKVYGTRTLAVPSSTRRGVSWSDQVVPAAMVKAPKGWDISVVQRANGIEWNNWATDFTIAAPANRVVVGLKYPMINETPRKGASRITEITYIPHNETLMEQPAMVASGPAYGAELYRRAVDLLRSRGVTSKALPGTPVVDVAVLTPQMSFRRMANEHMDPGEFTLDPEWTTKRIFMVIGANGDNFGTYVCSVAAACGPRQFIAGTWRMVADAFPAAKLTRDFSVGARDALQATMASVLLDDLNLNALMDAFGPEVLQDPKLEEYLTAAYNTGVARVINVVRIAQSKRIGEWTDATGRRCSKATGYGDCLLPETKGYIAKLRYLKDEWPQEHTLALKHE